MFNPILSDKTNIKLSQAYDQMAYDLGEAVVLLKEAAAKTHSLSGELYGSSKGALLLSVPNALVRGAFSALDENGLVLPNQGKFNAHIVVMTPEEVSKTGGLSKITERGKHFHYNLGPLHEGPITNSFDFSKVWFLSVASPELAQFRKTYGLDSGPGKHGFNIVVALRKLGVLGRNEISKLAAEDTLPGGKADNLPDSDLERAAKAKEVIKAINAFSKQRNIDPNQALLLAGGSMYFRGLKDSINDIDFAHPALKDFTKQTIGKYELDGGPGSMPEDAYASDNLYGLNVQKPEAILSFYKFLNRPKDQQKIQMLSSLVSTKAASKDILPGGAADNMSDSKFNNKKLKNAQKHEMEHTNNPAIAKEVAKDHMLEDQDYYKKLEKIEKKSEIDPSQLMLVSGHSGAGKTTAARKLSEMLNLPLKSIDDYPEFKAFFKSDPTNKHLELIKGSPERKEFKRISRNAVRNTIANLEGPAVVEGGQISYMPSNFLSKYPNRVIVKTPLEQLLAQRLERVKSRQLTKGKPWDEEIAKTRNDAAKAIYKSNRSSMDRFSKIPGTVSHGSRDSIEKLIQLLNLQKEATVRTVMGHEPDANVTTPAAEDIAFLSGKPSKPKPKPVDNNKSKASIRKAFIEATKDTVGVDPSLKSASWNTVLKKLKELGKN